jgi:hypothetical protein
MALLQTVGSYFHPIIPAGLKVAVTGVYFPVFTDYKRTI